MLSTKIRTTVITLVAAFSFAGASVVPAASQAMPARLGLTSASVVPAVSQAMPARLSPTTTNIHPVSTGTTVALEGHSTGDPGSLSEKQCQAIGEMANADLNRASEAIKKAEYGEAAGWASLGQATENEGLDKGCFFID